MHAGYSVFRKDGGSNKNGNPSAQDIAAHNKPPPTGLGSPWRVRRETARTRGTFFVKTFQKMVGNVLHEGPGMGQNGVAPWSTMYPQPGNSV